MKRKFLLYFFIFFISLILPLTIVQSANAKEYEISNYDIRIDLTEKGDYIITEKITYNFLKGEFTNGYREISDENLKNLEFISLDGVFTSIKSQRIDSNNGLKINWKYPKTEKNAEFILKYKAKKALSSSADQNIIDFKIIEKGWNVPLKNIDITVQFPQKVSGIRVNPKGDLKNKNNSIIKMHKEKVKANENYNLNIKFDKIIDTNYPEESSPYFYPLILGSLLGLLVIIITIIKNYQKQPNLQESNIKFSELSYLEIANIYYPKSSAKNKGLISEIFSLAQKGKIKIISKVEDGFLAAKKAEIKIEILSEKNLSKLEKQIIDSLKQENNLKDFLQKSKYRKNIMKTTRKKLKDLSLFNEEAGSKRITNIYFGILLSGLGIAGLFLAPFSGYFSISGIGVFLVLVGISRFIKSSLVPMLSSEGLYLQKNIKKVLRDKKDEFEKELNKDSNKAINLFFDEIAYLILHKKFKQSKFKKYKKQFKKADKFEKPEWIELDMSDTDKDLEALEVVEIIDYVMTSTIFVVNSAIGAAVTTGASGGSPGGGGAS